MPDKALLLVMMDVDAQHEAEFNAWYDNEHVPERMSVPGFLSARRFKAVEGSPKYLALYELESLDVLKSSEYVKRLAESPSEWTLRMRALYKNFVRNIYVEITA